MLKVQSPNCHSVRSIESTHGSGIAIRNNGLQFPHNSSHSDGKTSGAFVMRACLSLATESSCQFTQVDSFDSQQRNQKAAIKLNLAPCQQMRAQSISVE